MSAKELTPTPVSELSYARAGEVIELPGWVDGRPFYARVRRAALSGMIRAGLIPNPLIAAAQKLYEGSRSTARASFEDTVQVMHLVVEEALAEPTLRQLTDAGIQLTEQQLGSIYLYATNGPRALTQFRAVAEGDHADRAGAADGNEAERAATH